MSIQPGQRPSLSSRAGRLLVVDAVGALAVILIQPPAPAPADSPKEEFASGRAMRHVRAIATEPHPVATAAHRAVLEYVSRELRSLGLEPRVDELALNGVSLENLTVRLAGTATTGTVVLAAHYDSVPTGPGAGDDASGVATILETLRALKEGPPLRNDVLGIITDGEEAGLLGAMALVRETRLAPETTIVVNFEARGNCGPSILFETSEGNGALIAEFAGAAPHPVANSLSYAVYKLLPNDTDLSVFKKAGFAGLNFAFIDGIAAYHSSGDVPDRLSERTLQHHGSHAIALARRLGSLDLPVKRTPNAVYFNLLGPIFVRYPGALALPITLCVTALFGWRVARRVREGGCGLRGLTRGALVFAGVMVEVAGGLALLAWGIQKALMALGWCDGRVPWRGVWANGTVLLAIFNAAWLATARLYRREKTLSAGSAAAGATLFVLALLWAATVALEGATFLLAWPLFFAVLPRGRIQGWALAVVSAALMGPAMYLLFLAMARSITIAVLVAAATAMLWIAMLLPWPLEPSRSARC